MRTWFSCLTGCCHAEQYDATGQQNTSVGLITGPKEVVVVADSQDPPFKDDTTAQVSQRVHALSQLVDVMRACSGIPGSSYHQVGRICNILADHFGVPYVSASILSSTAITYLPIVVGGRLSRLCPVGLPQFLDASNASSHYHVAGTQRFLCRQVPRDELPSDWEMLRETAGLAAFMAAAITVGTETVAVLTFAHENPRKFDSPMWQTSLELLGASLGHLFRDRQLLGYCGMMEELMMVESLDELIRTLSRCVVRLQSEKLQQMRLTCRIACIASDAASAIIFDEVLPYTSMPASTVEDQFTSPVDRLAVMPVSSCFPNIHTTMTSSHRLSHSITSAALQDTGGSSTGPAGCGGEGPGQQQQPAQQQHHSAIPAGPHLHRGRPARLSTVSPGPSQDSYMASHNMQYQVQMHSAANLVPDPVDSETDPSPLSPHSQLQQHHHQCLLRSVGRRPSSSMLLPVQPLPSTRLPSPTIGRGGGIVAAAGGVPPAGVISSGRLENGGAGAGSCLSQPCTNVGGSLTGDHAREAGLWSNLDQGPPSNFSQHQLQVEGQTYLVANTLLAEAIANRAGVWIGDCVGFMQNPANPNADVFLAATAHHTTAMLLAVMWERRAGSGGVMAGAAGGVSGLSSGQVPALSRVPSRQQQPQPPQQGGPHPGQWKWTHGSLPGRLTLIDGSNGMNREFGQPPPVAATAAFGSFFQRPSPQHTKPLLVPRQSDLGMQTHTQTKQPGRVARSTASDQCGGGDSGGGMSRNTPGSVGGSSVGAGRGSELPLLAFYLLTSGAAPPSILQELLVDLRELLVVLEPLVSSKLADELCEEWSQLQREVLDKTKIMKQPKDRTIVLRNTSAQLAGVLNSHCSADDGISSSMASETFRGPPSPRIHPFSPTPRFITMDGAFPAGQPTRYQQPQNECAIVGGGGASFSTDFGRTAAAAAAAASVGGRRVGYEALRSVSEKALVMRSRLPGCPVTTGQMGFAAVAGMGMGGFAGSACGPRPRTPSFIMSRSFTGKRISALISGVQDRVQQAQRMSVSYNTLSSRPDDLRSIIILEKLGSGGFGTVYLGMYQSTEVAVKVIMERDCGSAEVLRNAVELAVLSTLSHPNIVQVLTFFTDVTVLIPPLQSRLSGVAPPITLLPHEPNSAHLDFTSMASDVEGNPACGTMDVSSVEAKGGGGRGDVCCRSGCWMQDSESGVGKGGGEVEADGGVTAAVEAQRSPAQKQQIAPSPIPKKALVILLEFCDAGCLGSAIRNGAFREKIKGGYGALQPSWSHIYLTLLEVALALRYLHSLNLVHRDLSPQNVLLKSSPADVRGFTAKLSDFGLVKLLTEADMMGAPAQGSGSGISASASSPVEGRWTRRYSGTISHVAPEAIHRHGSPSAVDVAVDIYAFGIVMWEILTGQPVYMGLNSDQIIDRVQNQELRPVFPADTSTDYATLASRCWDMDPRRRPTADELVQHLSSLSTVHRSSKAVAARRRLSTLSNKEIMRNVANANLAAANLAVAVAQGVAGCSGGGDLPRPSASRQHNEDDFPLHIL